MEKKSTEEIWNWNEEGSHSATVEDQYHQAYFEVLDLAITGISDRFNQPGYSIYSNLENLLVSAANNQTYNDQFTDVVAFYGDDFDSSQLSVQLQNLEHFFRECWKGVSAQLPCSTSGYVFRTERIF